MNAAASSHTVLKNSLANLVTGSSTALVTVLVPPVLARTLPVGEFSTWVLVLQIAGYTALLNLGMQTAVSRYVAYCFARSDLRSASEFVSSAFCVLCVSALVALAAILVGCSVLPQLFPQMPATFAGDARWALALTGGALALGLPSSAFNGVFLGIQRNEIVAAVTATTRLLLAGALIACAVLHTGIVLMSGVFAAVNLTSYFVLWGLHRRLHVVVVSLSLLGMRALREIWSYCGSAMIYSLSMLLVTGLDTAIVGRVEFPLVAQYSVCAGLIAFLAGVQNALFAPLVQVGAVHSAKADTVALRDLLIRATRLSVVLLLATSVPLLLFSGEILSLLLGPIHSHKSTAIFQLLIVGHTVRLAATPYAVLLFATNQHKQVLTSPLLEGLTNVTVAIVAGMKYGAMGVACGVVTGAVVGQLFNYVYNLPRTHGPEFDRGELVYRSVFLPILCFLPSSLAVLLGSGMSLAKSIMIRCALILISLVLAWAFVIDTREKESTLSFLVRYGRRGHACDPT